MAVGAPRAPDKVQLAAGPLDRDEDAIVLPERTEGEASLQAQAQAVGREQASSRLGVAARRGCDSACSASSAAAPAHVGAVGACGAAGAGAGAGQGAAPAALGPPECVEPAEIYKLYRGALGQVQGQTSRIWVDFPALQLCWAGQDRPVGPCDRISLLELSAVTVVPHTSDGLRLQLYGQARARAGLKAAPPPAASPAPQAARGGGGSRPDPPPLLLVVEGDDAGAPELKLFAHALGRLLASRDTEGRQGLEFIQKRLFQYLWRNQATRISEEGLYEAQAVLAFNLEPRQGVAYLKGKLGKGTDAEVGQWLAQMSTQKGGLDPTMLGAYFSRRDTLEVFKAFVRCLDFVRVDIVSALRLLFDTFKPGGEGQVITRILELFAEAYFQQWSSQKEATMPRTAYSSSDCVLQVAVSLIMLNTGLHVAPKKNKGKNVAAALMTVGEYISNTRQLVTPEEVSEEALRSFYEKVKQSEISVEPLPRTAFAKLPVPPDIEGWLVAVVSAHVQCRYWAVLALQRLYLFSDTSEVEPEAIDLKDATVMAVADNKASRERFSADLHRSKVKLLDYLLPGRAAAATSPAAAELEARAFELVPGGQAAQSGRASILDNLPKARTRLALVAESPDLMEKWVSLIAFGPY